MRQIIFTFLILATISCNKKNDSNVSLTQWNITKVEGSSTGNVNQSLALIVYWPYSSGCDILDNFQETKQANVIFVKAYGHTASGGICTDDAGIKTKIYNFTSATAGTFELRFINRDNSFISHFITIN